MKIFISYASEDRPLADSVHLALAGAGHEVFFDRQSLPAAGDYHANIRAAVDNCDAFIFLITPDSIAKGCYALTELKYAQRRWPHPKGRVLPVRVGDTPWESIPSYLGAVTVLEPVGNVAAEVLDALADLQPETHSAPEPHVQPVQPKDEPKGEQVAVPLEKRALAISMIHETGKTRSYTAVYSVDGDFWYGQAFASLARGSLLQLLEEYADSPGARFADRVRSYLPQVEAKTASLAGDEAFKTLLVKVAGEDPLMLRAQDQVLERAFFGPARAECTDIGIQSALGFALIADTFLHSGRSRYEAIKLATIRALDGTPATGVEEKRWLRRFADERSAAYARLPAPIKQMVARRSATYISLMELGKWDLAAPVSVRGFVLVDPSA